MVCPEVSMADDGAKGNGITGGSWKQGWKGETVYAVVF